MWAKETLGFFEMSAERFYKALLFEVALMRTALRAKDNQTVFLRLKWLRGFIQQELDFVQRKKHAKKSKRKTGRFDYHAR